MHRACRGAGGLSTNVFERCDCCSHALVRLSCAEHDSTSNVYLKGIEGGRFLPDLRMCMDEEIRWVAGRVQMIILKL